MPQPPWNHLVDLARGCAVRIEDDGGRFLGSGFFAAAGRVPTCAHVVDGESADRLRVRWSDTVLRVADARSVPELRGHGRTYAAPDVALLTVDAAPEHPVAWLSRSVPRAWTRAVAIGFSEYTPADHPASP
ncbi:hypothetical protein BJY16_007755 [Actinoplanes octamycinicus]|uniref:Trypsin-like peptidase n=1 Tax=Actinoplanes octamycinicus TaxID=135948 RepID=A0A7W7H5D2_9ACTN|nr:trypsin-like peptidase domain-containing protein [Actinoplanes octamycinicus]MBB4744296.1 hypothetical protein [Actinoplanes octamycinicus]GIE56744.1 hypothetical protein Aoc01nite_21460 [Actinoplanes octamycinicus]